MAGKTSKSQEGYYAKYKSNKVWETNRKRRLERVLKQQPNNEQIKNALKGMVYRRKTPVTPQWSHSAKRIAQLYKQFTGFFDRNILHPDPKVHQAALSKQSIVSQEIIRCRVKAAKPEEKSMFSLGARLQGNRA